MNKKALELSHELSQHIMDRKDCKITQMAIEPMDGRTSVRIDFVVYDKEEDCRKA